MPRRQKTRNKRYYPRRHSSPPKTRRRTRRYSSRGYPRVVSKGGSDEEAAHAAQVALDKKFATHLAAQTAPGNVSKRTDREMENKAGAKALAIETGVKAPLIEVARRKAQDAFAATEHAYLAPWFLRTNDPTTWNKGILEGILTTYSTSLFGAEGVTLADLDQILIYFKHEFMKRKNSQIKALQDVAKSLVDRVLQSDTTQRVIGVAQTAVDIAWDKVKKMGIAATVTGGPPAWVAMAVVKRNRAIANTDRSATAAAEDRAAWDEMIRTHAEIVYQAGLRLQVTPFVEMVFNDECIDMLLETNIDPDEELPGHLWTFKESPPPYAENIKRFAEDHLVEWAAWVLKNPTATHSPDSHQRFYNDISSSPKKGFDVKYEDMDVIQTIIVECSKSSSLKGTRQTTLFNAICAQCCLQTQNAEKKAEGEAPRIFSEESATNKGKAWLLRQVGAKPTDLIDATGEAVDRVNWNALCRFVDIMNKIQDILEDNQKLKKDMRHTLNAHYDAAFFGRKPEKVLNELVVEDTSLLSKKATEYAVFDIFGEGVKGLWDPKSNAQTVIIRQTKLAQDDTPATLENTLKGTKDVMMSLTHLSILGHEVCRQFKTFIPYINTVVPAQAPASEPPKIECIKHIAKTAPLAFTMRLETDANVRDNLAYLLQRSDSLEMSMEDRIGLDITKSSALVAVDKTVDSDMQMFPPPVVRLNGRGGDIYRIIPGVPPRAERVRAERAGKTDDQIPSVTGDSTINFSDGLPDVLYLQVMDDDATIRIMEDGMGGGWIDLSARTALVVAGLKLIGKQNDRILVEKQTMPALQLTCPYPSPSIQKMFYESIVKPDFRVGVNDKSRSKTKLTPDTSRQAYQGGQVMQPYPSSGSAYITQTWGGRSPSPLELAILKTLEGEMDQKKIECLVYTLDKIQGQFINPDGYMMGKNDAIAELLKILRDTFPGDEEAVYRSLSEDTSNPPTDYNNVLFVTPIVGSDCLNPDTFIKKRYAEIHTEYLVIQTEGKDLNTGDRDTSPVELNAKVAQLGKRWLDFCEEHDFNLVGDQRDFNYTVGTLYKISNPKKAQLYKETYSKIVDNLEGLLNAKSLDPNVWERNMHLANQDLEKLLKTYADVKTVEGWGWVSIVYGQSRNGEGNLTQTLTCFVTGNLSMDGKNTTQNLAQGSLTEREGYKTRHTTPGLDPDSSEKCTDICGNVLSTEDDKSNSTQVRICLQNTDDDILEKDKFFVKVTGTTYDMPDKPTSVEFIFGLPDRYYLENLIFARQIPQRMKDAPLVPALLPKKEQEINYLQGVASDKLFTLDDIFAMIDELLRDSSSVPTQGQTPEDHMNTCSQVRMLLRIYDLINEADKDEKDLGGIVSNKMGTIIQTLIGNYLGTYETYKRNQSPKGNQSPDWSTHLTLELTDKTTKIKLKMPSKQEWKTVGGFIKKGTLRGILTRRPRSVGSNTSHTPNLEDNLSRAQGILALFIHQREEIGPKTIDESYIMYSLILKFITYAMLLIRIFSQSTKTNKVWIRGIATVVCKDNQDSRSLVNLVFQ